MTNISATRNIDYANELSQDDEELLAQVLDDYLSALEQGAPLDIEQLIERHPQLATRIRSITESLDMLHCATQEIRTGKLPEITSGLEYSKRLGDFEISSEIGRGGMGVVYEARQLSLQRQVALKVLPFAAMWDQKQIARFRNEAQAAAQLQHPHIVPVFAVSQERGVHFYAMQLIAGQSLDKVLHDLRCRSGQEHPLSKTDWANASTVVAAAKQQNSKTKNSLSDSFTQNYTKYCRAIAKLGVQAAEALHYAHECGVVHRDIKPSNLLIDSQKKLWITDFGLARVQDNPNLTVTGDVVGTLRYMSPEQAVGQQALVDHRTDIYALGATLYELLALQPAFPGEERNQLLHNIEHVEPQLPSAINPDIPTGLETIILQAMAKSRDDRYQDAQALADDLKCYIEGKPTKARRPTMIDRSVKWLKRHRRIAVAATLLLLVVSAASTAGMLLLAHEKSQKEAALVRAEVNLQQARTVVDRFGSDFSRQLEQLPGSGHLRQELLQDTLAYYQKFIANSQDDPQLQAELAKATFQAADIANRLGKRQQAQQLYNSAHQLFDALEATTADASKYLQYQATCLNNLGLLLASQGDFQAAGKKYQAAINLQAKLIETTHQDVSAIQAMAEMHVNLSQLQRQNGEINHARTTIQHAIDLLEDLTLQDPAEPRHTHDLAIALNNRSFIEQENDWHASQQSCQAAIDLLLKLTSGFSETTAKNLSTKYEWLSDLALCYNNQGSIQSHLGEHLVACNSYREAIKIQEKLLRQAPAVVRYRSDLAVSWNNLGQAYAQLSDSNQANESFEQSLVIFQRLVDDFPNEIQFRSSLAGVLNNQAMALEHTNQIDSALQLYLTAIEHQKTASENAPQLTAYREKLNKHYINYGRALRKLARPLEAAQAARDRRQLWPDRGQHLYQIAQELAQVAEQFEHMQDEKLAKEQLVDEILTTLEQAMAATSQPISLPIDVADFQCLQDNPRFQTLLNLR